MNFKIFLGKFIYSKYLIVWFFKKLTNKQPWGILHFFNYLAHCEKGVGREGRRAIRQTFMCKNAILSHSFSILGCETPAAPGMSQSVSLLVLSDG